MGPKPGSDPNMIHYLLDDLRSLAASSYKKTADSKFRREGQLVRNILNLQNHRCMRNEVITCWGLVLLFWYIKKVLDLEIASAGLFKRQETAWRIKIICLHLARFSLLPIGPSDGIISSSASPCSFLAGGFETYNPSASKITKTTPIWI